MGREAMEPLTCFLIKETVNQADEFLTRFMLWMDWKAAQLQLRRELKYLQCNKWLHKYTFIREHLLLEKSIRIYLVKLYFVLAITILLFMSP